MLNYWRVAWEFGGINKIWPLLLRCVWSGGPLFVVLVTVCMFFHTSVRILDNIIGVMYVFSYNLSVSHRFISSIVRFFVQVNSFMPLS